MNLTDADLSRPRAPSGRSELGAVHPAAADWLTARLVDRTGTVVVDLTVRGGMALVRVAGHDGASASSVEVPVRSEPTLGAQVTAFRRHIRALGHAVEAEHTASHDARLVVTVAAAS